MADKKRDRTENFSNEECSFLYELIKNNIDIIECKKTDANISNKKTVEWNSITKEFNLQLNKSRNVSSLQNLWKRLKQVRNLCTYMYRTGTYRYII